MSTIGFIGAGLIGSTVARLSVQAGHNVVLSNSRDPKTLLPIVAALGPRARAATREEAAEAGDIVVVTVPLGALDDIPVEPLKGKTVIDTSNYYEQRDGFIDKLDKRQITTSQILQDRVPEAKVVKAFNNINFAHLGELARPAGDGQRTSLVIAGNDAEAKKQVSEFLDSIGYGTYDAGDLSEGWRFDNGQPAYGKPYIQPGTNPTSLLDMGPGHPATEDELRDALEAADRPE
ncbi:NADPH-dependent F420 reductase [Corynebacterium falsenii]|uniref:NADPH-dependent F420 reductase n=1 Tax=Corynebacterium falsenii TaxID=108486 RepID=UPI001D3C9CBA|nr:NAD(P)-binding domain-containing protein [Corynebacterium falsenii]HJF11957.1 NAD(P)-binding domain-containing protein [Corynebacterium falsenii]